MEWMLLPYRRYAEFSGRSRRKEFWMFQLLSVVITLIGYGLMLSGGAAGLLTGAAADPDFSTEMRTDISFGPLFWAGLILLCLWALASFIPSLAVTVRRLHDRNMSGWYLLGFIVAVVVLSMIPVLGTILAFALEVAYIVILALPGTPGPNKYGPDPLGQADPEVFA